METFGAIIVGLVVLVVFAFFVTIFHDVLKWLVKLVGLDRGPDEK